MKKILLLATCLAFSGGLVAQTFSDNFDSYTSGSYLAKSNSKWTTWGNTPGTTQDVTVSSAKAHSGTNSIYFNSSLATGGPVDEVLPFGTQYNTGTFTLEMWMLVDAGKVGYFNLQSATKVGTNWAMDMNLKSDGTFEILNTTDGSLLTGTYSQGSWMDIKLNIDHNKNVWELFINGTSKGTFTNSFNQIASMDVFAMSGSSFYIDDVSYTYTPYTMPKVNCALNNIGNLTGRLATQKVNPTVLLRNLGTTAITGCDISLTYNGNTVKKTLSGVSIASLDTYTVHFTSPITLIGGSNTVVATVSNVNGNAKDDDATDDTKSIILNPVKPAPGKIVIGEEATGTWCQWCPRGAVYLGIMESKYDGLFQGIAVHNNDPMVVTNYDKAVASSITGFPTVLVDRVAKDDPSVMEPDFLKRVVVAPKAILLNGAQYNSTTGELKVSLSTTFNTAVSGNYRIACVIIEDGVKGTGSGYSQSNAYAGGASGKMGGFETMTNPVSFTKMVYDHVARAIIPGFAGMKNSFPASVSAGSKYVHNFTFDVSKYNSANIHIVGMLIAPDGSVDNGSTSNITDAVANGFASGTEVAGIKNLGGPDVNKLSVYPNPASNQINISGVSGNGVLSIFDLSGKEIVSSEMNLNNNNSQHISLDGISNGIYMVRFQTAEEVYTAKIVVQK